MSALKNSLILAATMGLLTALSACGKSADQSVTTTQPVAVTTAKDNPAPKKQVGLVMKTLTNPFFVQMEKGARRAEAELGIALSVKTAAQETSIEQQIQLVEDLIAAKVDAIVIAPGDSQRMVPSLKKAVEAGIHVINIDNRLDAQAVQAAGLKPFPFVSVNNEEGAYKAGQALVQGINAPSQAIILEGMRSADNGRARMEGAKRALLENKHVSLVASETANWEMPVAYGLAQSLLAKHPQVKLVFAANDMMALGVVKYLQESGKTGVRVAGYDALDEALTEIKAGRMWATIDQQAAEQGYQGVVLALRLINGEQVAPVTTIDTRLVTAQTLK